MQQKIKEERNKIRIESIKNREWILIRSLFFIHYNLDQFFILYTSFSGLIVIIIVSGVVNSNHNQSSKGSYSLYFLILVWFFILSDRYLILYSYNPNQFFILYTLSRVAWDLPHFSISSGFRGCASGDRCQNDGKRGGEPLATTPPDLPWWSLKASQTRSKLRPF